MEPRRAIYYLAILLITLCGCQNLVPHDTQSLLDPKFHRSDVVALWRGLERPLPLCRTWSLCSSDGQVLA